jgi:uncharacterized membrane protein
MIMRKVLIFIFLVNIIFIAASLFILPDRVAMHFSGGGKPDSFGSKYVHAAAFAIAETFVFVIFLFIPYIVMKSPPGWMNMPNKAYWLSEENRPALRSKISTLFYEFATAFFVFMFAVNILAVKANLSEPIRLDNKLFNLILIGILVYTAYWCIKFFLSFRIPKENQESNAENDIFPRSWDVF